jgi:hypothetical protein
MNEKILPWAPAKYLVSQKGDLPEQYEVCCDYCVENSHGESGVLVCNRNDGNYSLWYQGKFKTISREFAQSVHKNGVTVQGEIERRYIVITAPRPGCDGDNFQTVYLTPEAANDAARTAWNHLTQSERKKLHIAALTQTVDMLYEIEDTDDEDLEWEWGCGDMDGFKGAFDSLERENAFKLAEKCWKEGKSIIELVGLIGVPDDTYYRPGSESVEYGELYYDGFIVNTTRTASGESIEEVIDRNILNG